MSSETSSPVPPLDMRWLVAGAIGGGVGAMAAALVGWLVWTVQLPVAPPLPPAPPPPLVSASASASAPVAAPTDAGAERAPLADAMLVEDGDDMIEIDGLQKEPVLAALKRYQDKAAACREADGAAMPGQTGHIRLQFSIGKDGKVSAVEPIEDAVQDPAILQCLLAEAKKTDFRKAVKGQAGAVRMSIWFE